MISESVPYLKPCPFCGNDLNKQDFYHDTVYPISRHPTTWSIHCAEEYGGCSAEIIGNNVEDIVKKWNRRS